MKVYALRSTNIDEYGWIRNIFSTREAAESELNYRAVFDDYLEIDEIELDQVNHSPKIIYNANFQMYQDQPCPVYIYLYDPNATRRNNQSVRVEKHKDCYSVHLEGGSGIDVPPCTGVVPKTYRLEVLRAAYKDACEAYTKLYNEAFDKLHEAKFVIKPSVVVDETVYHDTIKIKAFDVKLSNETIGGMSEAFIDSTVQYFAQTIINFDRIQSRFTNTLISYEQLASIKEEIGFQMDKYIGHQKNEMLKYDFLRWIISHFKPNFKSPEEVYPIEK